MKTERLVVKKLAFIHEGHKLHCWQKEQLKVSDPDTKPELHLLFDMCHWIVRRSNLNPAICINDTQEKYFSAQKFSLVSQTLYSSNKC